MSQWFLNTACRIPTDKKGKQGRNSQNGDNPAHGNFNCRISICSIILHLPVTHVQQTIQLLEHAIGNRGLFIGDSL